MRESFRLQKTIINTQVIRSGLYVFFVYTGNVLPQQQEMNEKMKAVLQKLQTLIHETTPLHS